MQDRATIDLYFVAFLGAAVAFGVFAALRFYLVTWLGERVVADVRSDVYARVIRMDPTFFEVTRTGEVLSRLTTDTTLVQSIAGVNLSITLRSAIQLVGALVLLVATSPSLAGMILVLHSAGHRAADHRRAPAAHAVAAVAGSRSPTPAASPAKRSTRSRPCRRSRSKRCTPSATARRSRIRSRSRSAAHAVRALLTAVGTMMIFGAVTFVLWQGAHRVLAATK